MAEIYVQVSDLSQIPSTVEQDFMHIKQFSDNTDYKITVEDFAESISGLLSLGDLAFKDNLDASDWSGAPLPIANGGTSSTNAADARVALGILSDTENEDKFVKKESSVPVGGIVLYSGTIASIPTNWHLCDGTAGTPDLRNKFVIGASIDSAGVAKTEITGTPTLTGGSKDAVAVAHTHTGTTSSSGTHTHSFSAQQYIGGYTDNGGAPDQRSTQQTKTTASSGEHTHSVSINSSGVSGTDKNLPPYYALAYIMRTS